MQAVSPILELQKQRVLLVAERDAERGEFQRQTETVGLGRKVKRGDCWWPIVVGRSYYNSLNQLVVEVSRNDDTDIEHNFEYGRQVMFFQDKLFQVCSNGELCTGESHGDSGARR